MLIPSILRILDRPQLQTKIVEKAESGFQSELAAAKNRLSALEILDSEIADAAEPVKPFGPEVLHTEKPLKSSGMSEWLRAITKFEKSKQSRVVDFFE